MATRKGKAKNKVKKPPTSSPASDLSAKPMTAIKYLASFLLRIICWLDVTLRSVGTDAGAMFGYLKLFGIKLGIDITELFESSQSQEPADFLKVVCYGVIVVFLCYCGVKRSSPLTQRLSGVAVLAAIVHLLWIILSPLPVPYRVCFVCVSGPLIAAASKIT